MSSVSSITPLKHQKIVSKFIVNPKNRGLIVYHSVGTGKTITSLLSAKLLLDKYPDKNVIIITPTSLVSNFTKEINKLNLNFKGKLMIYSTGVFVNILKENLKLCSKNILIIDEAHNLGRSGVRSDYIMKCALKAFKVILLTATPVSNRPDEIINLLAMINGDQDIKYLKSKLKIILENNKSDEFKKLFKCKVSFFKSYDTSKYPSSSEHQIELTMSPDYYKEYYKIQEDIKEDLPDIFLNTKNLLTFLNGARRAVNTVKVISPKIEWTINKIKDNLKNNKKVLVYSAWKQAGINILKEYFDKHDIKYSEVSGSLSKDKRTKLVNAYNNNINKIIIITAAGAEGLDLKETSTVIILEPHWNDARLQQIIGRAIRYESHAKLTPNKRHVDIFHLFLNKPEKKYLVRGDNIPSADIILKKLSEYKNIEISNFYKKLEKISIENDKTCF